MQVFGGKAFQEEGTVGVKDPAAGVCLIGFEEQQGDQYPHPRYLEIKRPHFTPGDLTPQNKMLSEPSEPTPVGAGDASLPAGAGAGAEAGDLLPPSSSRGWVFRLIGAWKREYSTILTAYSR